MRTAEAQPGAVPPPRRAGAGPPGEHGLEGRAVQLALSGAQAAPGGLVDLAGDLGGEPAYGGAAQAVLGGEADGDAQAHQVEVGGEDVVAVEGDRGRRVTGGVGKRRGSGGTGRTSERRRRVRGWRASGAGQGGRRDGVAGMGLAGLARAVRWPSATNGGSPSGRATTGGQGLFRDAASSQHSAPHATTSRAPVARSHRWCRRSIRGGGGRGPVASPRGRRGAAAGGAPRRGRAGRRARGPGRRAHPGWPGTEYGRRRRQRRHSPVRGGRRPRASGRPRGDRRRAATRWGVRPGGGGRRAA